MVTEAFCRFGCTRELHLDRGREFDNKIIQVCRMMRIDKTLTTPYRPQSDGLVENFNRTHPYMIFTYAGLHPQDWEDHLPDALCACRATVRTSTKVSPYRMLLGHEITLPLNLQIAGHPKAHVPSCTAQYGEWHRDAMELSHSVARR